MDHLRRASRSDGPRLTRRALLRGGVGYVLGTLFGVLILGTIQTLITFEGTLSSWWTRIAVGALLFAFCILQRLFEARRPV